MDEREEGTTANEPDGYDAGLGECPGENERSAKSAGVGFGDWDLWRPRRRSLDRREQARGGFPGRACARVGSRSAESRGVGDSRGVGALWNYFSEAGRRAGEDAPAVQAGRGRQARFGQAVDVVDNAG